MISLHRVIKFVLLILLMMAGTVVFAQKGGKPAPPPPPPVPLVLSDGLNIVTTEIQNQLRAWEVGASSLAGPIWTQSGSSAVLDVALADVDGEGDSEVVIPGACADAAGTHYVFLVAYKQNPAGETYSGKCDPMQWAQGDLVSPELVGRDLDGDNRDEMILRTQSHLFVFSLVDDSAGKKKWTVDAQAALQDVGETELGTPMDAQFTGRSLAVGDIDGEGNSEIITTGNYWVYPDGGQGESRTYLLVFSKALDLQAWVKFEDLAILGPVSGNGLPDFCVGYDKSLHLAETDSDGKDEIWLAGWTNKHPISGYSQRVMSFLASRNLTTKELTLTLNANWDLGWTTVLGPRIAVGKLVTVETDQIVLYNRVSYNDLEIWKPETDGSRPSGATWKRTFTDRSSINRAYVVGNRLILGGTLPSTKRIKTGIYFEVWDWTEAGPGQTVVWEGPRDGNQIWHYTVGFGQKQP
ncbi:MAG: hypothetical protein NTV05_10205 [Acidobacteria bacterium]|nr:hypothetical protein [Acidobacteriota bacterium]